MSDFLDRKVCPLCQGDNLCQVESSEACWCFELSIPKELLELVPGNLKKQSCLCEGCVRDFNRDAEGFRFRLKQRVSKR